MRDNRTVPDLPPETSALGHPFRDRLVTDGRDRVEWLRERSRGITATDVAKLSSPKSIDAAAWAKLHGSGFGGNAFTDHDVIARSRLRVDTRKWYLSKVLPKVYGEKLELTGSDGGPMQVAITHTIIDPSEG